MTTPTIPPELTGLFEASLPGGSAYALLKKFGDGAWSAQHVAHVISFAEHGPSNEARQLWRLRQEAARHGLPIAPIHYRPHPDVVARVNAEGAGNHADEAARILSEIVFRAQKEENDAEA